MRKARRAAARRGRRLRIMFADEARFGRMNRPRPCWAPIGIRPGVACQLIREYVYLYGAVSPQDGTCVYLIMPAPDTECFQIFLNTLAKKYSREFVLLFVDGAGNHRSDKLVIPANIMMHPLPAYSPELEPSSCAIANGVDPYQPEPSARRLKRHRRHRRIGPPSWLLAEARRAAVSQRRAVPPNFAGGRGGMQQS